MMPTTIARVLLGALLTTALLAGATASASPVEANALLLCLQSGYTNDARTNCIGRVAEPCLTEAEHVAGDVMRLGASAACYDREATAWETVLHRAVAARHADDPLTIAGHIDPILKSWQALAEVKCSLFLEHRSYGYVGLELAAECRMRETARMALFVGYEMDG
jgi:hypothetical protein